MSRRSNDDKEKEEEEEERETEREKKRFVENDGIRSEKSLYVATLSLHVASWGEEKIRKTHKNCTQALGLLIQYMHQVAISVTEDIIGPRIDCNIVDF